MIKEEFMSEDIRKELYTISEACGINSLTLTAMVNVLLNKGIITRDELIKAYDDARVSQATHTKKMKDDINNS